MAPGEDNMEAAFNGSELHFGVRHQLQLRFSTSTWDLSKCVNIFDFGNEGLTQLVPLSWPLWLVRGVPWDYEA